MFEMGQPETKKKSRKFLWATTGSIVVAGIVIGSYFIATKNGESSVAKKEEQAEKDKAKGAAPIPVEVTAATLGDVHATIESFATLESEQQAEVFAKTDGQVVRLHAEEGDIVREGSLIAEIAPEDRAIQAETSRLKAENARRELERAEATYARQMISQQDYEKLKQAAEVAAMDLKEAEWRLANTKVLAPFTGRITERKVVAGKTVKPGDHLYTLASYDPIVAKVYLPQKDLVSLAIGQKTELIPEAAPDLKWKGEIFRISPIIDAKTGTVKVTLKVLPEQSSVAQRPGTYVRVQIRTATRAGAVMVPKQALFEEDDKTYVFVEKNKKAEKRLVQVGYASNGHAEILSGVAAGEKVITMGMASLKESSELEILQTASVSK